MKGAVAALPKDSRLFYDWVHFTAHGAQRVADIIQGELVPFLVQRGDAPADGAPAP